MFQVFPPFEEVYIPPLVVELRVLMTAANLVPSADEAIANQFLTGALVNIQVAPEFVEM
jgi:hypothetical protein